MRRRTFFLGLSGLAGCTPDTRSRLNVFNWSEYIAPETISGFEREFSIRVHYGIYESNEELLAKVFSGNSGWDVAFPSHYFLKPMQESGLLANLESGRISNLKHLSTGMRSPAWDPSLDWGVPYLLGAAGIIHQQSIPAGEQSWELLWRPELAGKISMLDDPADTIGAALLKQGRPLNSTDPAILADAKAALIEQKRVLRAYLNSEARQQLVAGDLMASHFWTTTSLLAMEDSAALRFYYPREGYARYADCAVVLKESGRQELAHDFLNYLLLPDVAAANTQAALTTPANGSARQLLPPELQSDSTLFPDDETESRGRWFEALPPDAQRLRDRIWTEVKAA